MRGVAAGEPPGEGEAAGAAVAGAVHCSAHAYAGDAALNATRIPTTATTSRAAPPSSSARYRSKKERFGGAARSRVVGRVVRRWPAGRVGRSVGRGESVKAGLVGSLAETRHQR